LSEKKKFYIVQGELSRLRLIRQCAKNFARSTIWNEGREAMIRGKMSNFDPSAGTFQIDLNTEMPLAKVLKLLSTGGDIFFNVEFESSRILFRTTLTLFDESREILQFRVPTEVFRLQKRNFERLNTRNNPSVIAFHLDPLPPERMIRRKVLDVGGGGLALGMIVGEERHYWVGQVFEGLELHIGEQIITARTEIVSMRIVEAEGEKQELIMGLAFLGLNPASRKFISEFVDSELLRLFGATITGTGPEGSES
jgi:c-di-GMP-binding flagellar brake protein YcgR